MFIAFFIYGCNSKCMELISEDVMKSSTTFVNKFGSKNAPDTYLQSFIGKKDVKRKRPRYEDPKKKEFTFIYHIKINGVRKVVQESFLQYAWNFYETS